MKNKLLLVVTLWLLSPLLANAGALYGTVRIGQLPAENLNIFVACPAFNPGALPSPTVTDSRGSFSIRVASSGRCQMRVGRQNVVGTAFDVFVSNNPLRFDFTIDKAMNRVR